MEAITSLIYVEGDLLLTSCNVIALVVAVEFFSLIVSYLGRMGRR